MKKLSVQEKAKAYDEALERARKINSGECVAAPPDWTLCEVLFPVLREDKDMRIRRALISILKSDFEKDTTIYGISVGDIIDWLGKIPPQNRWTPSNKQIKALQYVYQNLNPPLSDKRGWDSLKTLELMYRDLKKLIKE